jgi:hypothetical protein
MAKVLVAFLCVLGAALAHAHPPHNPFLNPFGEDTRFAPVTDFGPKISIKLVTRGMIAPLKGVAAPGLPNHLFVVDQVGTLWIVDLKNPNPDTNKRIYLDLRSRIVTLGVCGPFTFDERGFLGVAFSPDFAKTGKFYTYTSERRDAVRTTVALPTPGTTAANADHHNVVAEWRANPGNLTAEVSTATRRELLHANWPQFNHDGGDMAFGPDGMLYISTGDGGGADDADGQPFVTAPPHHPVCGEAPIFGHQGRDGNGQRLNTALGKILRIDVGGVSLGKQYRVPSGNPFVGKTDPSTGMPAVPEIWAFGLRNPFRFSFDRKTGELYVGDVGQNDVEEVDIIKRGGNYGWNCKEGTPFFHVNGSVPDDGFASDEIDTSRQLCVDRERQFIDPIAQHDTHREGHSVIGGFVYHGKRVDALRGKYVFADFSLLFKFPLGPHDYGRLFTIDAHGNGDHGERLRKISELMVVPGGAVSLAVLGMGEDARGEIYVTGNISGLPFPDPGADLQDPADDTPTGRVIVIIRAEDENRGRDHDEDD